MLTEEHLELLAWREVPIDESVVGPIAHKEMPHIEQLFVKVSLKEGDTQKDVDRELFIMHKQVGFWILSWHVVPHSADRGSLSSHHHRFELTAEGRLFAPCRVRVDLYLV